MVTRINLRNWKLYVLKHDAILSRDCSRVLDVVCARSKYLPRENALVELVWRTYRANRENLIPRQYVSRKYAQATCARIVTFGVSIYIIINTRGQMYLAADKGIARAQKRKTEKGIIASWKVDFLFSDCFADLYADGVKVTRNIDCDKIVIDIPVLLCRNWGT